jgi:putative endonuclease
VSAPDPRRPRRAGLRAEQLVESHLVARGWLPLSRNHVVRGGEVDLVLSDGPTVVFVEVKRRRAGAAVDAFESVTAAKQRRIVRAARDFLSRAGLEERPVRFDVVAVTTRGRQASFEHLEAAFDAGADD